MARPMTYWTPMEVEERYAYEGVMQAKGKRVRNTSDRTTRVTEKNNWAD
jgi:hypothetical protein